ncbi:MAG: alcohol dehydrogenase catalytic domain-containing protein [Candidatus Marinimicrobia bacterium]|nr:alcohol dehydrogenase catalytic domain-containing protein [Candidatus Neomarinimicrobiota bacterium]MCF7850914.1 alcohol dehydrogenase catalytic domain-containing protein [Candidatus Neomarinimicrobiota bacterium]
MKAAILQAPRKFTIEDIDLPVLNDDEVLVRTKACGICSSELPQWKGTASGVEYPRLIGHEPSGVVEAVGREVTDYSAGDRVTAWSEGGGFAEYFKSKAKYLHPLKEETPFHEALGEPLACAVNGMLKASPEKGESVAIVGTGYMGLLMIQAFRAQGCDPVIAIDTREEMLSVALEHGAHFAINPQHNDLNKTLNKLLSNAKVDIGVEAAGLQETLDLTAGLVRMEGKLEIFGFHQGTPRSVDLGYWNWMAFDIINGHSRSDYKYMDGLRTAIELLENGDLNCSRLITHKFSLNDINAAFTEAEKKNPEFIKAVIDFESA